MAASTMHTFEYEDDSVLELSAIVQLVAQKRLDHDTEVYIPFRLRRSLGLCGLKSSDQVLAAT